MWTILEFPFLSWNTLLRPSGSCVQSSIRLARVYRFSRPSTPPRHPDTLLYCLCLPTTLSNPSPSVRPSVRHPSIQLSAIPVALSHTPISSRVYPPSVICLPIPHLHPSRAVAHICVWINPSLSLPSILRACPLQLLLGGFSGTPAGLHRHSKLN